MLTSNHSFQLAFVNPQINADCTNLAPDEVRVFHIREAVET